MKGNDSNDSSCWREVSWSKYSDEVEVTETNNTSLHEQWAHVTEVEELSLQMHNEILRLSIIPHILVLFSYILISSDWMEFHHFTKDKESNSRNNPVEEEHDLDEQPGSNKVHFIVPGSKVHLDDVDHITEYEHWDGNEQWLQCLAGEEAFPPL